MKLNARLSVNLLTIAFVLFFLPLTSFAAYDDKQLLEFLQTEATPSAPLLPVDITVNNGFEPGVGEPIGEAQLIQGTVLVIHQGAKIAYTLKKDLKVFTGDILITKKKSRVELLMNDKSLLSLASQSKLIIDESIYDAKIDYRDTDLQLLFGRVRSIVTKVGDCPNYTIKTPTGIAGVRGTDFAVAVGPAPVKDKTTFTRFLNLINPVRNAHAILPVGLLTAVLTGAESTVVLTGRVGATTVVGPNSVAAALTGSPASAAMFVGEIAAGATLEVVGPSMALMSVPAEL